MELLVCLVSGAIGGNLVGSAFGRFDLGIAVNTLAGLVGGYIGWTLVRALIGDRTNSPGTEVITEIVAVIAVAAVFGGLTIFAIGMLRRMRK